MISKEETKIHTGAAVYQITVEGFLEIGYLPLTQGMNIHHHETDSKYLTIISGSLVDQSALSGLLNSLTEYRYTIVSVLKID
jgi:hypothetical protein